MPTDVYHSRELTPVDYKDNLIVVVSDPDLPLDTPGTESKRIYLNQLLSVTHDWDPITPISGIAGLKSHDFLRVINTPNYVDFSGRVIKNGDHFLVVSVSPAVLFLIPARTTRVNDIVKITSADSPYNALINSDIYVDVSTGPVTISLPTVHGLNDNINILPFGGRYEVNNLTINCAGTDTMHGTDDPVIVSSDNLLIQARWIGGSDGYIFISR
jgi:hypothetical protein